LPAGLTVPPLPKQPRRHCASFGEKPRSRQGEWLS
jgi:hypothetical protein